jgi:DNA modification methylase
MTRALYFGDNLDVLRESIADQSVDLVYLDPPFNSQRSYNLLFRGPKGRESDAQITAFEDTWHWGQQAEREYDELLHQPNTQVAEMVRALRGFLGENDVMAYLVMMANRLLELHRVLKPTGSLYLHCDPTASHYLKIVLDGVFGKEHYINEISWKRTTTRADYAQGATNWPRIHDILFYYAKSTGNMATFHQPFRAYDESYLASKYRYKDTDGRVYRLDKLTAPGSGTRGHPQYEFMGVVRFWTYSKDRMQELLKAGRIVQSRPGTVPQYKRYLDEVPGVTIGDFWDDIDPINSQARERLGYPTQKPLALLQRIIQASSNEGDVVLDPFCGCGTAVHAAEHLKRQWIGIDITHLAISLIEKRLRDAWPSIEFEVHGTPKDYAGAVELASIDKYQFQWWACSLVNAQPYQGKKKGADRGIDGLIFFRDDDRDAKKIVVSVKGGENVGVAMVRDLVGVLEREQAEIGLFVTLSEPTQPMIAEAAAAGFYEARAYKQKFPRIQILTVRGLLEGSERPEYINVDADLGHKRARRETTSHRGHVEMELER